MIQSAIFCIYYCVFVLFFSLLARADIEKFQLNSRLEGPESAYTSAIVKWIEQWPPKGLASLSGEDLGKTKSFDESPVKIQCIQTSGNQFYIGLRQEMRIYAPLSRVEGVLDDIDHYQYLFPGYKDIHVVSRTGNRWLTYWEQDIPLFFVPNVKYFITYLMDKPSPTRKFYRYKLKESRNLRFSDGLIVLEEKALQGTSSIVTDYVEFDFFDADWGVLKTLAPGKIWKESVEGIYLSDAAIKLKAEHSEWSYQDISKESRKFLSRYPIEPMVEKKVVFNEDFSAVRESTVE